MFASCYGRGLTQQLAEQSIGFARNQDCSYLAVSDPREQFSGLHDRLRSEHVGCHLVDGLDTHRNFRRLSHEFEQVARRFEPTAVIAHTNWQFLIASVARRLGKGRYNLVYVHNGYRHNRPIASIVARFLITCMLRVDADLVIAPCKQLRNTFSSLSSRTVIIHLGQDDQFFTNPVDWTSSGQTSSFVFGGEFRKGKNQSQLISVFQRFAKESGNVDWKLYLPGEGALLENCREKAAKSEFRENIALPGKLNRAQMLELYDRCQFAVVPTNSETFGHCIVEPFIRGRVVLSRTVGVAADILRHGENGFLFRDWDHLVECLKTVTSDRDLCIRVSKSALVERDQFRWDRICAKTIIELGQIGA